MTDASDSPIISPSSSAETLFSQSKIFNALSPDEVREVVRASEQITLEPGEFLFHQNDVSDALYIVSSGEFEVRATSPVGEEIVLAMLGSGTVIGEMSLIGGGPRSASVKALSPGMVFRLTRTAFQKLRAEQKRTAYKIILQLSATLAERRLQTEARIQEVFTDPESHIDLFEHQLHDMLGQLRIS